MVPVKEASGRQFYVVEAANKKAALEIWESGDGDFEGEDIEVTTLGHGDEIEVEEIDDE